MANPRHGGGFCLWSTIPPGKMGIAEKTSGVPLPARLAGLLREARWLLLVAVAAYLLLIFATFQRSDPGWSHSATGAVTRNAGGVVGAWLSDVLLNLLGLFGYWWSAVGVCIVIWCDRRFDGSSLNYRRPLWASRAGFA